jgi:RNA polymerase sigma-70 factor (ECF subfamily)
VEDSGSMPNPQHPDDLATLLAARDGDQQAGVRLVTTHGPSMVRTAWSVAGRTGSAEVDDIVQEAFIGALTTPALPEGDVGAWLRAITARKALDWLRQSSRRQELSLGEPGEEAADLPAPGDAAAPVAVLTVRKALEKLSPLDRAVLTLVDLEGFSMGEAAGMLGASTVAMKWRAVRARRRLRVLLGAGYDRLVEEGGESDE